jgi:hypothetical protein
VVCEWLLLKTHSQLLCLKRYIEIVTLSNCFGSNSIDLQSFVPLKGAALDVFFDLRYVRPAKPEKCFFDDRIENLDLG